MRMAWVIAAAVLSARIVSATSASADELGETVRSAVAAAEQSVVRLRVIGGEQSIEGETVSSQITTGLAISETGEIITSQFALDGNPQAVLAIDADGQTVNASVVATDHVRRLVLLKAASGKWVPVKPPVSDTIRIGQWTIAVGRFHSAEHCNVSVGILSAVNRIHGLALQTDAKVSPINYGGPLVDLDGGTLGVLVPLSPRGTGNASSGVEWYDSGIGFAIPITDVLQTAERLRSGTDLKPGRMGLSLNASSPFDSELTIRRLAPGGPAEVAGLQVDDRIVSVNSRPIDRASVMEEVVAQSYAGDILQMDVQRGDSQISVRVQLVDKLPIARPGSFGFLLARREGDAEPQGVPDVAAIARLLRERGGIPGAPPGDAIPAEPNDDSNEEKAPESLPLIVVNDTPAALAGLPTRIELLRVNGKDARTARELRAAIGPVASGTTATFEYRAAGTMEVQTTELRAAELPESVPSFSDAVLAALSQDGTPSDPSTEAQRRELSFDDQGEAVILAAKSQADVRPGVVLLLSAHDRSEDDVLQQWQPYLTSRRLIVAVPRTPEGTALTRDDTSLILASLQTASSEFKADLRRVVVVVDQPQAELGWQLAADGPSPITGLAITGGWLSVSKIKAAERSGLSVMLPDRGDSAQAEALLDLNASALRESGFAVVRQPASDMTRAIADWTLWLATF